MDTDQAENLCLRCGLCCNGVIFADVQLQAGDDPARLRGLGFSFPPESGRLAASKGEKFTQPCAAYDECRCRVYWERPRYCREFECLLLGRVKAGKVKFGEALRLVQKTFKQAETVKDLLRALGDSEETLSLNKRFRRTGRRVEQMGLDEERGELFGKLTLAVHDLNLLLSGGFYPGDGV